MAERQLIFKKACRSGLLLWALISASCSSLNKENSTEKYTASSSQPIPGPSKYHLRESQFVFYSDFPLKANMLLFKELSEMREQICKELQLPPSNTVIQVYLFEDETKYVRYMQTHYTDLPVRRAFFIKQPHNAGGADDLCVFTWWGNDTRKDLRHELTHGILHSVLKDVPIWLDEGLAQIYELPPESNGVNLEHMETIRRRQFHADLARLELLTDVKQMLRPEYRESWAWTHFLLRSSPETKTILLAYLQQLRNPTPPSPLYPKLKDVHSSPTEALADYLSRLESPRPIRVVSDPHLISFCNLQSFFYLSYFATYQFSVKH